MTRRIRIIAAPPGEAPQHIREAWIGCVLPVIAVPGDPRSRAVCRGVLTRRPAEARDRYLVRTARRGRRAARRDRDAAQWWRESVPRVIEPGQLLAFPEEVCERLVGIQTLRLSPMTTRRWMIVILIVAVGIISSMGWYRLWRLGSRYRSMATTYGLHEAIALGNAGQLREHGCQVRGPVRTASIRPQSGDEPRKMVV